MHDLETVAIAHRDLVIGGARHDLKIALDSDLGRVQPQAGKQAFDGQAGAHTARLAIQGDIHDVSLRGIMLCF